MSKEYENMRFFIDTAKIEDIQKANDMGVICGVTTNPSLIAKDISETKLSEPDRSLMLKRSIISDDIIGCPPPASEYHGVLLQTN